MKTDVKVGGRSELRVFVQGCPDLVDTVAAVSEGGRKLDAGLAGRIRQRHPGTSRVEVELGPRLRSDLLVRELELRAESDAASGKEPPDIALFSLQLDLLEAAGSPTGALGPGEFRESVTRLVDWVKQHWGAHVVFLNASSVDPEDHAHTYRGVPDPLAVRIHRFNLELVRESIRTGISVVDVDRMIAEIGGARNVHEALEYSPEAHRLFLDELVRILEDVGFFEARPLMPQVGRP